MMFALQVNLPRPLSIALGLLMILAFVGTIVWVMWRSLKKSQDPARLVFKWILSLIFTGGLIGYAVWIGPDNLASLSVPFACVAYGVAMSVVWAPNLGALLAKPFTSMFDGGDEEPDPEPLYSAAISRRKLGRFEEAVQQIKNQLERFPNDFKGQMLLAEIQAEDLNDMPSAEVTIQKLCQQKGHSPGSISAALLQLADWKLKYWQDPDSARESLQKIEQLYPNTEFAHVAAQRIAHLASQKALVDAHDRPRIHLRHGIEDVGLQKNLPSMAPPVEDPAAQAAEYIKHLEQYPLDTETREQLARIYADHYQRIDYAVAELEQIIRQPGQSEKQIVRLLNLIADMYIKVRSDYEGARDCLQRIIDQYPTHASAETAQRRLSSLRLELRSKQKSHIVQLGTYEQDIGLKKKLET